MMQRQKYEWQLPSESDLQIYRQQYKNVYGYSLNFLHDNDLFGEQAYYMANVQGSDLLSNNQGKVEAQIQENGQVNLTNKKAQSSIMEDV